MIVSNTPALRLAVAVIGTAACTSLLAQQSPYYYGAAQGFTHESNVFRDARGVAEVSDTHSTTTLLAGIDQPISRQRLFADLALRLNRYQDSSQLNNTGGSLALGADWATIENLSGRVSYTLNQNLARSGADLGPVLPRGVRNMEKNEVILLRGQYGLDSLMSIEATVTHRELDYSALEFASAEFRQDQVGLGVRYQLGRQLTVGGGLRHTEGKYPLAYPTQADAFKRDDFDLSAVWVATAKSTLTSRLSYTRAKHEAVAARNISGTTGALSWSYKPTAKTAFTTDWIRDSGAESSFARPATGGVDPIGNNSRLSQAFMLRGMYEATAKIQVEASARVLRRDLVDTLVAGSLVAGSDKLVETRLGVNWTPLRSLLVNCSVGREKRDANTTLSFAYSANFGNCLAQFRLQ